jgi:adenosylcobinamide-GDP ribazoletransferase
LLLGSKGVLLLLAASLFSLVYRFFFIKKLGGITGDILGAADELAELLCLILLVLIRE